MKSQLFALLFDSLPTFQIIFLSEIGGGIRSDIALDDIEVTTGGCDGSSVGYHYQFLEISNSFCF